MFIPLSSLTQPVKQGITLRPLTLIIAPRSDTADSVIAKFGALEIAYQEFIDYHPVVANWFPDRLAIYPMGIHVQSRN